LKDELENSRTRLLKLPVFYNYKVQWLICAVSHYGPGGGAEKNDKVTILLFGAFAF
jgi:hypothetical protein